MKLVPPLVILLVLCCISCSKDSHEEDATLFESDSAALIASATEIELLNLVNDHRISNGLSILEFSNKAYPEATAHTDYMIAQGELSHDNFDVRASKIAEKTNAKKVAENVARDYDTCEEALTAWLSSDSHKKTLEGNFSHTSISIKKDAQGIAYFTQVFFKK